MSWPFGGRNRTYVGTAISRVIADDQLPDISKDAAIKAILLDQPIVETLMDESINSLGVRTERAMRYAKSGGYTLGLPNHTFMNDSIGTQETKAVLEALHDGPVDITYHHFSSLHNVHVGFSYILDTYNYDEATNQIPVLSNVIGSPVYLENIVGIINTNVAYFDDSDELEGDEFIDPNPESLRIWDVAPNKRNVPWTNPYEDSLNWEFSDTRVSTALLYYAYLSDTAQPGTLALTDTSRTPITHPDDFVVHIRANIGLSGFNIAKPHFQTKYVYDLDSTPKIGYFTYEYGKGTYTTIDNAVSASGNDAEFLPFVFFRHDRQDITIPSLRDGEDYITSKKLMKKLGIDYQNLSDEIHKNEDVGLIEQAVLMFAIPINSEDTLGIRYLYEFFHWLSLNDVSQTLLTEAEMDLEDIQYIDKTVVIEDRDFRMQLNYGNMSSTVKAGTLVIGGREASVGDTTSKLIPTDISYTVTTSHLSSNEVIEKTRTVTKTIYIYTFLKQISDTHFREIRISGLNLIYRVYGEDVYIDTDDDAGRLLIPINYAIAKQFFTFKEKPTLYGQSMHLVFNSRVTKRIPWYATSFFKGVLAVVAIVITVFSLGQLGPAAHAAYIGYAALYGSVIAVVLVTLEFAVLHVIVDYTFSYLAEKLGAKFTFVLALLALVASAYGVSTDASWAPNLLKYSTSLIDASTNQYSQDTNKYLLESQEFETLAEEKWEALREIQKSLETDFPIDPLELVGMVPMIVMGETPDEFYNRTTKAGNVGTLSYDYIQQYVDLSLKLPTFQETIRGFNKPNE